MQKLVETCTFLSDKVDETVASSSYLSHSTSNPIPEETHKIIQELKQMCDDNRILNKCAIDNLRNELSRRFSNLQQEELSSKLDILNREIYNIKNFLGTKEHIQPKEEANSIASKQ